MISLTEYKLGISSKKTNKKTIKVLKTVEKLPAKPESAKSCVHLKKGLV